MNQNNDTQTEASNNLRSRAESILQEKSSSLDDVSKLSVEQLQGIVHELQVHQIELELQNEELRETQQELSTLMEDYVDLYDMAPVGYLTVSDKGIILRANLTVAKMLGVDRVFLPKKRLSTFIAWDDQDKYYLNMMQLNNEPTKTTWELHLKRADDSVFEGQFHVAPLMDVEGSFQGQFKFIISDISEIGEIQRKLLQSETTFRSVFENSKVGIILGLPDGTILKANPSACVALGRTEDELRAVGRSGIVDLNDQRFSAHWARIKTEGKSSAEVNYVKGDGTVFPAESIAALFTGHDGSQWTVVSFMDITRRKEAEKRLLNSEKRFRELVELLPSGIFETDGENRFTFTNSSHKHISGVALNEDIIGKLPTDFVDPVEHHKVFAHYEAVKKSLFCEQEYTGWERNGVRLPDILVKVAQIMSEGQLVGFRGVVTDISSLKQAEREKQALQEQLFQAQKLASLGTLVGGIAHDFNNMLQVIVGYSELLMDEVKQGGVKLLGTILDTSQQAADLVTKFMALGQQSMAEPKLIDLNDKIRDMESLILHLPHIEHLNMDLVDEATIVKQNPDQLGQIMMILATNASEAMRDGGSLSFSTTKVVLDEAFVKTHYGVKPGPYVMLTVTDTGRGIDKTILPRIFDPFFSTKQRCDIKGMGLGLSVLRGIVQQRGGFVTCESELGKGTTFRVYFPEIEAPDEAHMLDTGPSLSMPGKSVLIVEDNALVSGLEETAFNKAGYKTIVAPNGEEAVNIYRRKHANIGLVILDLLMPEMNGRECLMELLKINPLVKAIVLSGHDPKSEIALAVKPHVAAFLPKPCKMSQLVEAADFIIKH